MNIWERLMGEPGDRVTTVHLGQFTRETANQIASQHGTSTISTESAISSR